MPGLNGGSLRRGGATGGRRRGAGRPPSIIREKLRGSFEKRIKILEQIADGEFVPHLPKDVKRGDICTCGAYKRDAAAECICMASNNATMAEYAVSERLKAVDLLGKYGMGTTVTETDTDGNDVPRPQVIAYIPDNGRSGSR